MALGIKAARYLAALLAVGAGIAVLTVVLRMAADGVEPWASWREAVRIDGFIVLVLSAGWLVCGALFQTPVALMRRASLSSGWIAVAVIALFHLLLTGAALALLEITPALDAPGYGRRNPGPHWYNSFLFFLLIVPAVAVLSGSVFRRAVDGVPGWRLLLREDFLIWPLLTAAGGIGAALSLVAIVVEWLGLPFMLLWTLGLAVVPPLYRLAKKMIHLWRQRRSPSGSELPTPANDSARGASRVGIEEI